MFIHKKIRTHHQYNPILYTGLFQQFFFAYTKGLLIIAFVLWNFIRMYVYVVLKF